MKLPRKRWLLIFLAAFICLIALAVYANYALEQFAKGKAIRTTTATVTGKEFFECKEKICTYVGGYGDVFEMKNGETQQRVYFQIDNFNQFDEPMRSRLMQAEKERVAKSGARFTYSVNWYDKVKVGDKIEIGYRAFRDGQIQVWNVGKGN